MASGIDSRQWALEKLQRANRIFEPDEKPWWAQLGNFLFWALQCALLWELAHWTP